MPDIRKATFFRLCLMLGLAGALPMFAQVLHDGAKPVWDASLAWHETTPTRERISINGLWRWQPSSASAHEIPTSAWGYLRVPQPWPNSDRRAAPSRFFFPEATWAKGDLRAFNAAWYQREITVPREWVGRRITLQVSYLNSYAEVYLDGKRAGEMRYPAGTIDLTASLRPGETHVLSILVVAMPLKAVMLSYNDTASARTVEGTVARKGLCGDVYLASEPAGSRLADVKLNTSVRNWQMHFDAGVDALDPRASYMVRAQVYDGAKKVREFSHTFVSKDAVNGRIQFHEAWHPDRLWDIHTPGNQYRVTVSLLDAHAKPLDIAAPLSLGFREFWIDGRDFYLNGSRIYLSALPIDNAQGSPLWAGYEAARATMRYFKSFGINMVYTHNYGCEPGAHLAFEEILRAADDEGLLVSFSQPHFSNYDWTTPEAARTNGYETHAAFYVGVAQNHPSVVFYSMSHNATGYSEDMNPDMIDGIHADRDQWALRNATRAQFAEKIVSRLDPYRIVYHHASGNLGPMHVSNFYGNWIPIQEMSDWFQHWAATGVKPLFTCEYSVPFLWDWGMYRGWYQGKREFGSAVVPWDFEVAEWDAQFLGDRAYKISDAEKANLRWEARQYREGRTWHRWDYPESLNSTAFDDRFEVVAAYITDNWRAFRTLGVSATSPWEYGSYWKKPKGETEPDDLPFAIDWDHLQAPGPAPRYLREGNAGESFDARYARYQPTEAAEALQRNNRPLLGYIAGKPDGFTSKDHNVRAGERIEKQLIVINNSRSPITCAASWSLRAIPATGGKSVTIATGQQARVPIAIQLPRDLAAGQYRLDASFLFGNGEKQSDSFAIDVLPPAQPLRQHARVALFDPPGETARLLDQLGMRYTTVTAATNLSDFDVLIAGKGALSLDAAAPDVTRVRRGLRVVVFEQTGEVLEQRFGFRVAEYGLRTVFPRIPDHPLLAGITPAQLCDWRGASTVLPPRLRYEKPALFNMVPTVKWAGLPVTRVWRNGNRGNVASALIEKPVRGDFLPIVDGGYALQYSPLLQYREGLGMVLFCQLDVTARSEPDPAADALVRNILNYAAEWKPGPQREVVYAGAAAGREWLESAGFRVTPGNPAPDQLIVVGPGAKIPSTAAHVLALGLDEAPGVSMTQQEHIATYFDPQPASSPLAGISPADVQNRDPRKLSLVGAGADVIGDGVLGIADNRRIVFSQLVPWQFPYTAQQMNLKRTFRRVSFLTARILANLGAASDTPLLGNFSQPTSAGSQRWLTSYYLDRPEEWDDPYRFFRW